MSKPSRVGPWCGLGATTYLFFAWFANIFAGNEAAVVSIVICVLSIVGFIGSCWWMNRQLNLIDKWKEEREMQWFLKTDMTEEV